MENNIYYSKLSNSSVGVLYLVPVERATLSKERLAGYYRLSAYFLAKLSVDIPLNLIPTTLFVTSTFWVAGLSSNFGVFLNYLLTMFLITITSAVSSLVCQAE